jgi:hypothetical protein
MTITTLQSLPDIKQYYNSALLSTPKFGDNLQVIHRIFLYIEKYLKKRIKKDPIRKEKSEKLAQEFLYLYDATTVKEKELEESPKNRTKELFYYIDFAKKGSRNLFSRLRTKSFRVHSAYRKNDEV